MTRILALAATAMLVGCGGGSGGGGSLRAACTKICGCFEETSSFSGSSPATCVDDCVASGGSFSVSNSGSGGEIPQACVDCINAATCDGLVGGSACTLECNF